MDDGAAKLVMQWIALVVTVIFFGVSVVKWARGIAVTMFGVMLMNAGFVAENYGINALPIVFVSLLVSSAGVYMLVKERKGQRSASG